MYSKSFLFIPGLIFILLFFSCNSSQTNNTSEEPVNSEEDSKTTDNSTVEIEAVIVDSYVQGLHQNQDESAMRKGFHQDFVMHVNDDRNLIKVPLSMWLDRMKLKGEKNEKLITHEFTLLDKIGQVAKVKVEVFEEGNHLYTDYFGLYLLNDGWKIVNKIFQGHEAPQYKEPEGEPTEADVALNIESVIVKSYIMGLHQNRNENEMNQGFHNEFVMHMNKNGDLITRPMADWLQRLKLDGEPNEKSITHNFTLLDYTKDAAQARVDVFANKEHIYTDYFGLYHLEEGWKIVNKLFHSH